jgi:hypothetical protein
LLKHLARTNKQLARLGAEPICTETEARELPDYRVRELVMASDEQAAALRRAMRGYLG